MDKTLTIIVAATVFLVMTLSAISLMTSSVNSTDESKDQFQNSTTCLVQTREAQRSDTPSMVEDRCLDYIDDTSFRTEAETAEVDCWLSGGTC